MTEEPNKQSDAEIATTLDIPSIARSPRSVTAFIGRTERGPVDEPTLIRSYNHYREVFGGHATFSFLSYTVQHFFLHGGRNAVVVRVVNRANRALIRIPAGDEFLELVAKQPGSREFLRVSIDYDGVDNSGNRFNLVVQRMSRQGSQLVEDQEIFAGISLNDNDARFVSRVLDRSRLVALRGDLPAQRPDPTKPLRPGESMPYLEVGVRGSDGVDLSDYDIIGSNNNKTGLWALDAFERIDFVCIPPAPNKDFGTTTFLAAERYCERRRAILIWDPPLAWENADTALIGARSSVSRSSNALTYFPRIKPRNERVGLPSVLPACGALAGILAAKSDSGDWRVGSQTDPSQKISLSPAVDVPEEMHRRLHRAGVNTLVATGFGGAAFVGNVTLAQVGSVSMLWQHLDRRRLLLFLMSSIESAGLQAIARSRNPQDIFAERVAAFLHSLTRRDAFASKVDELAYQIRPLPIAPNENSEPRVRVGFALLQPSQFLYYDFTLGRAGCSVNHAPALEADQLAG